MKIDDKLLQKLEKLAMLEVRADKREEVKTQLNDVLDFIDKIAQADTKSIVIKTPQNAPLREDEVALDATIPSQVLEHAPKAESNFFIVPKIIE